MHCKPILWDNLFYNVLAACLIEKMPISIQFLERKSR